MLHETRAESRAQEHIALLMLKEAKVKTGIFAPSFAVDQRRKKDDARAVYDDFFKQNKQLQSVASWNVSSSQRVEHTAKSMQMKKMWASVEEQLASRKSKLSTMLAEEDQQYQVELEALQETTEQRKNRLKQRARELIRRREEERRELAQTLSDVAFRENSDIFRQADSMRLNEAVQVENSVNIGIKLRAKEAEREADAYWHEQFLGLGTKLQEREDSDKAKSLASRGEMLTILTDQIRVLNDNRAEALRQKAAELQAMKDMFEMQQAEARQKERDRKEMFRQKQLEAALGNKVMQDQRRAQMMKEREEDMTLLNNMLDREARQAQKEQEKKDRVMLQALEYRKQLEELMKKEAVSDAEANAIRQADIDKVWKKREDQWEREREYRRILLADVMAMRQKQVAEQLRRAQVERELNFKAREQIIADMARVKQQELSEREDVLWVQSEHRRALDVQVREHQQRLEWEKRLQTMEWQAQVILQHCCTVPCSRPAAPLTLLIRFKPSSRTLKNCKAICRSHTCPSTTVFKRVNGSLEVPHIPVGCWCGELVFAFLLEFGALSNTRHPLNKPVLKVGSAAAAAG